ncbi:MAG: amidohydrolase family protein [Gemmatimonadaceae bacterium]|jgi:imidazolonepropionase-like amidohydrolase|nr:amidohydrolase family protein [Gemmatimonadaceae bacterium]
MPSPRVPRRASAALAACLALATSAAAQPSRLALVGGTLIDGYGGAPLANSVILIEGERITAVGQVGQLAVPATHRVISTEGMSVLPGLWEMHAHLMLAGHGNYPHWDALYPPLLERTIIPATAKQLLMAGVTSVRDLGAPLEPIMAVKRQIDSGALLGATIYPSGPFIQHAAYPGTGYFRWGVNGAADARAKVKRLAEAGVTVIKLIDQDEMTMEEVRAVVDEAHAHRLPVVAHAHRPEEVRRGLAAGVDDFEHTGMATANEYPADVIDLLKARTAQGAKGPLFWTPTIDILYHYQDRAAHPEFLDDPAWHAGLPDSVVRDIRASLARLDTLTYYRAMPYRKHTLQRKFQQLREAGVQLLIGTDAGVPAAFHSGITWQEMRTWVRDLGMDPMLTIRAATFWPAVAMGVEREVGTVTVGKVADIIAVRGNVLDDIALLRDVPLVIKRGARVK